MKMLHSTCNYTTSLERKIVLQPQATRFLKKIEARKNSRSSLFKIVRTFLYCFSNSRAANCSSSTSVTIMLPSGNNRTTLRGPPTTRKCGFTFCETKMFPNMRESINPYSPETQNKFLLNSFNDFIVFKKTHLQELVLQLL